MSTADAARPTGPATRCDFCHAAGRPLVGYACRPFTLLFITRGATLTIKEVGGIVTRYQPPPGATLACSFCSIGDWAACPACAPLIDAGDAPALGRRMLACQAADGPLAANRTAAERQVAATLGGFWRHRSPVN